jgi:hypothetical protein
MQLSDKRFAASKKSVSFGSTDLFSINAAIAT